jgi:hypothetical protein
MNHPAYPLLRVFFLLSFLLLEIHHGTAFSQKILTQTIKGVVIDQSTGAPLPGAYVVLIDSDPLLGTVTNMSGEFILEGVPVGRRGIRVSFMGFKPRTLTGLDVVSGKQLVLNIALEEQIIMGADIKVQAYARKDQPLNEMATISARSFSVEETEKYAGSLGDPARMAMNFAGVMGGADQINDIIIRGNSPAGLLWKLEGIHIPNPNHFGSMGSTGGPISMLNNNVLSNSDFYTGAFSAEYGNALSGVFDLRLRNGNSQKREYTLQAGLNGAEIGAEGPFIKGRQHTYIAHYRYSTLAALHWLGLHVGVMAIPYYQDLSFKLDFKTKSSGHLTVFGMGGMNHITLQENEEGRKSLLRISTKTGVLGLSHTHFFNSTCRLKTGIAWSVSNDQEVDSTRFNNILQDFYRDEYQEQKISLVTNIRKKFSPADLLIAGVDIDLIRTDLQDSILRPSAGTFFHTIDVSGGMMLIQSYINWKHKFTDEFQLIGGIHHQQVSLNRQVVVEPRISASYDLDDKNMFNAGYGLHSLMQSRLVYFDETLIDTSRMIYEQTNRKLGFSRSHHFVVGFQHLFNSQFRIKTEAYYQMLFDIPVQKVLSHISMINYGGSFHYGDYDSLVNKGTGRNVGLECTFEHFLTKNYYYLVTLSLFDSKYKASDGKIRNTVYNGNFIVNFLGGYEFQINNLNSLSLDLKAVWAGGIRYIPIDVDASVLAGETVYDYTRVYKNRYDDYYRVDVRLSWKLNRRKFSNTIAVDIQNVTNRYNRFLEDFNVKTGKVEQEYQIGILPVVLWRVQF